MRRIEQVCGLRMRLGESACGHVDSFFAKVAVCALVVGQLCGDG